VKDDHGAKDEKKPSEHELKLVALETFYVNLDGSEGYKLLKVTMSLEVDTTPAQDEILRRQAQVRDMIIILLTSKRYGEVSGENAQDKLKAEIIDTVNSILTKGKIKKILFTEFLFQ
jgi:flagellar FliL protein